MKPCLALLGLFFLDADLARANPLTWNGPVGGNWNTTEANWTFESSSTQWSNGNPDDATFGTTGAGAVNLTEAITAGTVTFSAGYTLSGSPLTVNTDLNTGTAGLTLSNIISGAGKITHAGGVLNLSGANDFVGGVLISGGTVNILNDSALGTGAVSVSGGSLMADEGAGKTISNVVTLTGTGKLAVADPGDVFILDGALNIDSTTASLAPGISGRTIVINNQFNGTAADFDLVQGILRISSSATVNYTGRIDLVIAGTGQTTSLEISDSRDLTNQILMPNAAGTADAILGLISGATSGTYSGALTLQENDNGLFDVRARAGETVTLEGNISDDADGPGIEIVGGGTVIFTGANSYGNNAADGITNVKEGTLQIGNGGTTGTLGNALNGVSVASGANLVFKRSNDYSYTGVISGAGTVTQAGSGTTTLGGVNTYTGATAVNAGTLQLGNNSALGFGGLQGTSATQSTTVASGGTLNLDGTTVSEPSVLNGAGVDSNGALVNNHSTTAATVSDGVAGASIVTAGGNYSVGTTATISGGGGTGATAAVSLGVTLDSFVITSGTTTYSAAPTVTIAGGTGATASAILTDGLVTGVTVTNPGYGFTAPPTITLTGGTVLVAGANPTGSGVDGKFAVTGISITNAGSDYTSEPTVGINDIGGGTGTGASASVTLSSVSLASDSSVGGSGNMTIDAVVSGSGALNKVGAGILTLTGANTYTDNTTVTVGTLVIAETGQLKFVLGSSSGSNNSLTGAGTVTLDGDFVIDTTAADALTSGTWTLEDVTTITGGAYGSNFSVIGFTDAGSDKWTKDIGGGKVYTFDEATGILTLATTGNNYSTWAASQTPPVTEGPNGDDDDDGVENLVEYALADGGERGVLDEDTITFTKRGAPYGGDVTYDIEVSTDLGISDFWETAVSGVTEDGSLISYSFTPGTPVRNFARLKVVRIP